MDPLSFSFVVCRIYRATMLGIATNPFRSRRSAEKKINVECRDCSIRPIITLLLVVRAASSVSPLSGTFQNEQFTLCERGFWSFLRVCSFLYVGQSRHMHPVFRSDNNCVPAMCFERTTSQGREAARILRGALDRKLPPSSGNRSKPNRLADPSLSPVYSLEQLQQQQVIS